MKELDIFKLGLNLIYTHYVFYVIPQKMFQGCRCTRPDGVPFYDLCLRFKRGTKNQCVPLITDTSKWKIVYQKCPACCRPVSLEEEPGNRLRQYAHI